jgi:hypothetical protein
MDNEVFSFALKNTLNEIRNVCPDITSTFIFREDGEIIAGDEGTPEKTMVHVVDAFDGILEKAEAIGGIEHITLEGNRGTLDVSHMNNIYFVTVTSTNADVNYVSAVTRVLIPTVLRLLEKISPTPPQDISHLTETKHELESSMAKRFQKPAVESNEEKVTEEPKETIEPEIKPKPSLLEPPTNQLIVENLGGLLVPSDTVRIDSEIMSQWEGLYEGKRLEEVEIETFDGKTTRCKVKPIKDSKYDGRGIIQMPEKIQLILEIKKGELVRAKPIVE